MNPLLSVILLALLNAPAQDNVGTIIVLAGSQDKIAVAADSRMTLTFLSQGGKSHDDTECKIATLEHKIVFAAAGRKGHLKVGDPELTWDSYVIAHKAAKNTPPFTVSPVKWIAGVWAREVAAMHNRDFKRGAISPEDVGKVEIESAFFVGVEHGTTVAYIVRIVGVQRPRGGRAYAYQVIPLEMEKARLYAMGRTDVAVEFAAQQTDRAKRWLSEFETRHAGAVWDTDTSALAEWVVKLTMNYSASRQFVGGPIDVVEVRTSGIRWIRRKHACPE